MFSDHDPNLPYMKTLLALLPYCFCHALSSYAQTPHSGVAIPFLGLDAYSLGQVSVFSFTGNTASLARVKHTGIGLYGERRFMLAANSQYALAGVLPTRLGQMGIQFQYAGFRLFNEYRVGLAYARSLGSKLDMGIRFNYSGSRIPAYQQASALDADLGLVVHLTGKLHVGLQGASLVGAGLGKNRSDRPLRTFTAGFGYDASPDFYLAAEISKTENNPVGVLAGMQYRFASLCYAMAGFSSVSSSPYAGAGLAWHDLRLSLSVSHHPQLGFSPGILLLYQPKWEK